VNSRNLVANTPRQRRSGAELDEHFPAFYYETKSDTAAAVAAGCREIIENDDAAQLLCAVFLEEPWVAVKRNSLFDPENHPRVFSEVTTAAHVVFVHELAKEIQAKPNLFPADYRRSWRLMKLVAAHLVGQLLRASSEGSAENQAIRSPKDAITNIPQLRVIFDGVIRHVAASLAVNHDARAAMATLMISR
jgi:hypothetical protein